MGIPAYKWGDLPSPGLVFWQNLSQEVLHMEPITDEVQEVLLRNKHNAKIMRVGYTILDAAAESSNDGNWWFIYNQSTCNAFIVGNICKASEMPLMDNIYVPTSMQEKITPKILIISLDTQILSGITQRW